jgi:hypothetical protein
LTEDSFLLKLYLLPPYSWLSKGILSVLSAETGLAGSSTGLTGSSGTQTGPVIPDNSDLVPRVENSASDNLERDKADVVDWRKPIIAYL